MNTSDVVSLLNDYYSIENTLKRRGFDIVRFQDEKRIIQKTDELYKDLKSFTNRQILKIIYESELGLNKKDILNILNNLNEKSLTDTLKKLISKQYILNANGSNKYIPIRGKEFGRTFEWFISEVMRREIRGIASSGIKFRNLKSGGEYDVICRLEDDIVYIECKSGNINNINKSHISNFFSRMRDLVPSLAILLIDTKGISDNFKSIFKSIDWKSYIMVPSSPKKRRIKGRGIFYEINAKTYVVTAENNLIGNIRLAINHFYCHIKPYAFLSPGKKVIAQYYDEYDN